MGQFSWLDCVTGKQILDGVARTSYVLVPAEFGGGHIVESCYDGYGHFGGYDIYDLVADWNKEYLIDGGYGSIPRLEDYGGLSGWEKKALIADGYSEDEVDQLDKEAQQRYYQAALNRAGVSAKRMADFSSGKYSDAQMRKKYGADFKREIGIDIACYDEDNERLVYPIKITYDPNAVYEQCEPSPSDPNQGWGGAEPCEMFYAIMARLPDGVKFNKPAITKLVKKAFEDEVEGKLSITIRDALTLRQDEGYEPDDEEGIEYIPDNEISIHVTCIMSDPDYSDDVRIQIYEIFEQSGYEVLDVYYDSN